MRNIFFVDSENVGDSWIQLFDYLNDDDCILVFYTDKSPNMSYANVVALKQSPFEPEFILCENGTDNALDFQLVTYLGSYTVKNPDDNLIIVSKDKGFDSVVHFWTERGYHVCRKAPSIFHTLANELSVQKPMLPAIPAFTAVPESIDDSVIKAENPKPDVIVELPLRILSKLLFLLSLINRLLFQKLYLRRCMIRNRSIHYFPVSGKVIYPPSTTYLYQSTVRKKEVISMV